MRENSLRHLALAAFAACAAAPAAQACPGVGVILRIQGRPQDVVIMREGAPVARPRVLEVICQGDSVRAQNGAAITLSLDGLPNVTVSGPTPYPVGARRNAPTLAANAYQSVSNRLLPDMKRQPWDVRLRGPGPELGFALTTLAAGRQTLTAGARPLLVRMDGGVGAYKVELDTASGAVLDQGGGASADITLPAVALTPGAYVLKATDSSGATAEAHVSVVADGPPLTQDYAGMSDKEVQAAAMAAELARAHSDTWGFEAEQILNEAPKNGLDRDSVFELIESYDDAP